MRGKFACHTSTFRHFSSYSIVAGRNMLYIASFALQISTLSRLQRYALGPFQTLDTFLPFRWRKGGIWVCNPCILSAVIATAWDGIDAR